MQNSPFAHRVGTEGAITDRKTEKRKLEAETQRGESELKTNGSRKQALEAEWTTDGTEWLGRRQRIR